MKIINDRIILDQAEKDLISKCLPLVQKLNDTLKENKVFLPVEEKEIWDLFNAVYLLNEQNHKNHDYVNNFKYWWMY